MPRAKSDATFVAPLSRLVAHSSSSLEPPSSGFMERLSFPASTSTPITRTWTSWPIWSSSAAFSTKPSLICLTCTKPCATASLPGTGTSTKAPKVCVFTTLPVSHWDDSSSSKGDKSTSLRQGPRMRPPPPPDSLMEQLSVLRSASTLMMRTLTSWPLSTTSSGVSQKPSWNWETCIRACATSPPGNVTTTKAPKGTTLVTWASSQSPESTHAWKGSQL
mmetsp:Transcript_38079/g.107888  ORF Transcript_38079/g.107888 Transcript_38079/m.107888 type:complete len:219 (-) Transcript_38079:97-753(-)